MLEKVAWHFGFSEPKIGKSYYSLKAVKNEKGEISFVPYQIPHLISFKCILVAYNRNLFCFHTKRGNFFVTYLEDNCGYYNIVLGTEDPIQGKDYHGYSVIKRHGKIFLEASTSKITENPFRPLEKDIDFPANLFICTTHDFSHFVIEVV